MAIVSVREMASGRRGSLDQNFDRTYTRTYVVITDSAYTDALSIQFATGLPKLYDPYEIAETSVSDPQALVTDIVPTQPDPDCPELWHVDINYSTRSKDINFTSVGGSSGGGIPSAPGAGGHADTPELLNPDVSYDFVFVNRPFEKTADDVPAPVVTAAGEKFNVVPEVEDAHQVIRVRRAELVFDRRNARNYINHVNRGDWNGELPRTVRCTKFSGTRAYQKGKAFWWVDYEFQINEDTWDLELLNAGTVYYPGGVAAVTARRVCTDAAGNVIVQRLASNGDILDPVTDATTVYLTFRRYPLANFDDLNLPL